MLTVLEILGYVLLYVILYACLSRPFRRSKMAHLVAAGITGIVFLAVTLLPEKDMRVVLHYMTLGPGIIIFLFVVVPLGWLAFRVLRSNGSFLQRMGTVLLIAAAQSFLIWFIVSFMVFNLFLGGDPFRGKIVGAAYYFGRGGDEYIRVTPESWWISFWILVALHCIPPLCLVSGLILTWLSRLRDKNRSENTGYGEETE